MKHVIKILKDIQSTLRSSIKYCKNGQVFMAIYPETIDDLDDRLQAVINALKEKKK